MSLWLTERCERGTARSPAECCFAALYFCASLWLHTRAQRSFAEDERGLEWRSSTDGRMTSSAISE